MLTTLSIPASYDTPQVVFDPAKGHFKIAGTAYPNDAAQFFLPLLQWIDAYDKMLGKEKPSYKNCTFEILLDYFNSTSAKFILQILQRMSSVTHKHGLQLKIKWYYYEADPEMKEMGMTYQESLSIPVEILPREIQDEDDQEEDITSYLH